MSGRSIYTNGLEFFVTGNLSFLPHLGMYSSLFLTHYGLVDIYFMLWFIMWRNFIYFFKLVQIWPLGALSSDPCGPLTYPCHGSVCLFLSISFLSGMTKCPRLVLCISCPCPRMVPFIKDPCFLYWEIILQTIVKCVYCYRSVLAPRPSQLTERGDACVYTPLSFHSSQVAAPYFFPKRCSCFQGERKGRGYGIHLDSRPCTFHKIVEMVGFNIPFLVVSCLSIYSLYPFSPSLYLIH